MTRTAMAALLGAALAALGGCVRRPLHDAGGFARFRGGKDAPTYRAVLVDKAPVVDGKMDAAYKAAQPIRFVFINGERRP